MKLRCINLPANQAQRKSKLGFPALTAGFVFPRAHRVSGVHRWLRVFPRLPLFKCFLAVIANYIFNRAYPRLYIFLRLRAWFVFQFLDETWRWVRKHSSLGTFNKSISRKLLHYIWWSNAHYLSLCDSCYRLLN